MRETRFWVWHMIAGLAILALGGMHMIIMHMDTLLGWFNPAGGDALDWQNVVARAKQTFFAVIYILLLVAALFHGFYGFRNILMETGWGRKAKKAIDLFLWVFGVVLFAFGSYVAIVAQNIN